VIKRYSTERGLNNAYEHVIKERESQSIIHPWLLYYEYRKVLPSKE
jgi:hypothetical protein